MSIARQRGVLTPEDPYQVFEHSSGPLLIVPLFLLYDYSYRPAHICEEEVYDWAMAGNAVCSDEFLLHPDPFTGRAAWCRSRCETTLARLNQLPASAATVLINHFCLKQSHAVLPRVPRFTPWCGTTRTEDWHLRFNARAVVHGHLHIRNTRWTDGVPFQEVSLGAPSQWRKDRGIGAYLHEVELASPKDR
ncbi:hypothetical protein [Roseibium sp. RKSG952]|uniref:hypothetical protein n=1 Tax=Roseibium sp. RKSG952 TaxID=2529384 RepID=UPI001FCA7F71|nr:hypothetical protein [Roseibium sp. RKSG952]